MNQKPEVPSNGYLAFGLSFLSLRYDGDRAAICMFFFKAAKYIHLIGGFFGTGKLATKALDTAISLDKYLLGNIVCQCMVFDNHTNQMEDAFPILVN